MKSTKRSGKDRSAAHSLAGKAIAKAAPIIAALLLLLAALAAFDKLEQGITGFAVFEKMFTTAIGTEITANTEIPITLEAAPTSLSISGKLTGKGTAKAYLLLNGQKHLILDTSQLQKKEAESLLTITGRVVEDAQEQLTEITAAVADTLTAGIDNATAINETTAANETQQPEKENKAITAKLQYNTGTAFDNNDDGIETEKEAIDYTVAGTQFSWAVNESKLCTRWKTESPETNTAAIICNGNSNCCQLVELTPKEESWKEPFQIFYGAFNNAIGYDNNVSAQVIYADYSLETADSNVDVAYSEWQTLPATFLKIKRFKDECEETCKLPQQQPGESQNATIIVELENTDANTIFTLESAQYTATATVNTPPQLLKQIENLTISTGKKTTLNLTDYFTDADNDTLAYKAYKAEGITITISQAEATITPEPGFTGKTFTHISATDNQGRTTTSNTFTINIAEAAEKEETEELLEKIEINKPAKWRRTVRLAEETNTTIEIPAAATAITVKENNLNIEDKVKVEEKGKAKKLRQHNKDKQLARGITAVTTETTATAEENITLIIEENATQIEVEYETPAPTASEKEIGKNRKEITINSQTHYENITAHTTLQTQAPASAVKLYWLKKTAKQKTQEASLTWPTEAPQSEAAEQIRNLLSKKENAKAGSKNDGGYLKPSLESSSAVDSTSTRDCFLRSLSSDQTGQPSLSASAKYSASSLSGENCLDSSSHCMISSSRNVLICILTPSNADSNLSSGTPLPSEILFQYLPTSNSTNSGLHGVTCPEKNSSRLLPLAISKDMRMFASTTTGCEEDNYSTIPSSFNLSNLPFLICLPSSMANLSASSSDSFEPSSILSSLPSKTSLFTFSDRNFLTASDQLTSGNLSNLCLSSSGTDTVMFGIQSPPLNSVNAQNNVKDIFKGYGPSAFASLSPAHLDVAQPIQLYAPSQPAQEEEFVIEKVLVEDAVKIDTDGNGLVDRIEWIVPSLSNQTYEVEITVLNPYTYLRDGEIWTVAFNTTGTADLTINSTNANWTEMPIDEPSTDDEMRFLNLSCGAQSVTENLTIIGQDNNEYAYPPQQQTKPKHFRISNYSCNNTSYVSNMMNIAGYATLMFTFGDQTAFAYDPYAGSATAGPSVTPMITNTNGTLVNSKQIANASVAATTDTLFAYANFTSTTGQEENSTYKWFLNNTNQSWGGGNRTAELVPMIYKDSVLYLHLDENGSGAPFADSSGNGNNAAIIAGNPTNVSGLIRGAVNFDGTGDYLNVSDSESLTLQNFTVSVWLKTDNPASQQTVVRHRKTGNFGTQPGWSIELNSGGISGNTFAEDNAGNYLTLIGGTSNGTILAGAWTHLAIVRNGTRLTIYRDGEYMVSNTSSAFTGSINTPDTLQIGAIENTRYFAGLIDELAIYNRSLSASEIKQLYLRTWYGHSPQLFLLNGESLARINASNQSDFNTTDNEKPTAVSGAVLQPGRFVENLSAVTAGTGGNVTGYWRFDAGGITTTANDTSSFGNDGTLYGNTRWVNDSVGGLALKFDGDGDYVNVSDSASLDINGSEITIELWYKPANYSGAFPPLIQKSPLNTAYQLILYSSKQYQPYFQHAGSGADAVYGSTVPEIGTWNHVVATFNGTHSSLYMNGKLENTTVDTELSVPASNGALQIGGDNTNGRYFNGSIDEVRILNRSLSAAEVLADYKKTATGMGLLSNDYINYSAAGNFNEKEGTMEFWIKPQWNGNDGLQHTIVSVAGAVASNDLQLLKRSTNSILFFMPNPGLAGSPEYDISGWTSGSWKHIAVTWNNYTSNRTLHIDGVQANQSGNAFLIPANEPDIQLGSNEAPSNSAFCNCTLSEFRISRKALTAQEINLSFSKGRSFFQNEHMLNGSNYAAGDFLKTEYAPRDRQNQSGTPMNSSIIEVTAAENQAPTVTFTYPTNNAVIYSSNVSLQAGAGDGDGDAITFYWYINGTFNKTTTVNTTINFSRGNYAANVSAYDGTNFSVNASTIFTIANNNISAGQARLVNYTKQRSFNISAAFVDPDGSADIANRSITTTAGTCNYLTNTSSGNLLNLTYNCTNSAGLTAATVTVTVNDTWQNTTKSSATNTYPDHGPNITISNPASGAILASGTTSAVINITTDENANCRYNTSNSAFDYDTEGAAFETTGTTIHNFTLPTTASQSYTLYYKCSADSRTNDGSATHTFTTGAEGICDVGGYSSTCTINSTKNVLHGSVFNFTSMIIDGNGSITNATAQKRFYLNGTNLTIHNGGQITGNFNITVVNLSVRSGGLLNASFLGYAQQNGGGTGESASSGCTDGGGGAGHGGKGGIGGNNTVRASKKGGNATDSVIFPTDFGSGGGQGGGGACTNTDGGNGGGIIHINSTRSINDGTIQAGGFDGQRILGSGAGGGGGGAGGTITITTTLFGGAGSITASGGAGGGAGNYLTSIIGGGGGGAGGRMTLYYENTTYTGTATATGGSGGVGYNGGTNGLAGQTGTILHVYNLTGITETLNSTKTAVSQPVRITGRVVATNVTLNNVVWANVTVYVGATQPGNATSNGSLNYELNITAPATEQMVNVNVTFATKTNYVLLKVDTTPPMYNLSVNATPTITTGTFVNWSINMTDTVQLANYTFGFNNSGSFANDTPVQVSGTSRMANVTKTITAAKGSYICAAFYISDNASNVNNTEYSCLNVVNSAPAAPTVSLPAANSTQPVSNFSVNYTSSDTDGDSITYYIYLNNTLNTTAAGNTTLNLSDGGYTLNISAYDGTNFSANTTVNFAVDTHIPFVAFGLGTADNDTYFNRTWVFVNVTVTEANISNTTFRLYNSTHSNITVTNNTAARSVNFTGLAPNNVYYYNVTVVSNITKSNSTETRTITLDDTPPWVNLTKPLNNSQSPATVNFTWRAIDALSVPMTCSLVINNTVNVSAVTTQNNTLTNYTLTMGRGDYNWSVNCTDRAGLQNASANFIFSVDFESPAVTLLAPPNNTYDSDGNVTARFTATDATGIANCSIYHNISGQFTLNQTNTTMQQSQNTEFDINNTADSINFVWAIQCADTVEPDANTGFTANLTVTVDKTAPASFTLTTPANRTITTNTTPTLTWTATTDANFANYTVQLSNFSDFNAVNYTYYALGVASNTSAIVTTALDNDTYWHWKVTAYDKASNNLTAAQFLHITDNTAPLINLTATPSTAELAAQNFSINWTATDLHLNVSYVNVSYVNGTLIQQLAVNSTFNTTGRVIGNYTLTLFAVDNATNTNTTKLNITVVDTTPPGEFSLLSPAHGTVSSSQSPTLDWQDSLDARLANYTIEISNSSGFAYTNHTFNSTDSNLSLAVSLTADMAWYWRVVAFDMAGNTRRSTQAFTYTTDNSAPSISGETRTPAVAYFNAAATINATITDAHLSTVTLEGNWTGSLANYTAINNTAGIYTYTISNTELQNNEAVQWRYYANDTSGNIRQGALQTFTVTNRAPGAVNLTTPINESEQLDTGINFTWTPASDDDNDSVTYELLADDTSTLTSPEVNITGINATSHHASVNLTNGLRYWSVRSHDGSNYSSFAGARTIAVYQARINITNPANNTEAYPGDVVTFNITELNETDWIKNTTLTIRGANYTPANITNTTWQYNYTVENITAQTLTITAYAYNHTTNTTAKAYVNIAVLKRGPAAPVITRLCSNETYALNNTNITLQVISSLDTLLQQINTSITTPENTTEPPAFHSNGSTGLVYHHNYTYRIASTGLYSIQANITDAANQTARKSGNFQAVNGTKTVSINQTGISITVQDECTGNTARTGNQITIPENARYTIKAETALPTVTFSGANLTGNVTTIANYTDLGKNLTTPTGTTTVAQFELNTSLTDFNVAIIAYNYTAMEPAIANEDSLQMHRCANITSCTYQQLNATINTSSNIISANTTNFSAFIITEELQTTTTTTTTTSAAGGGGGSNTAEIVRKENVIQYLALDIVAPAEASLYSKDEITMPINVVNKGNVTLKGISLHTKTNTTDLEAKLSESFIGQLEKGEEWNSNLRLISHSTPGRYEVIITAKVEEPLFEDTAKVYIDLLEINAINKTRIIERIRFAKDLFKENPECLELQAVLEEAEKARERGEYQKAAQTIEQVVNACKDLITSLSRHRKIEAAKAAGKAVGIGAAIIGFSLFALEAASHFVEHGGHAISHAALRVLHHKKREKKRKNERHKKKRKR